jgi:hypothetical protein
MRTAAFSHVTQKQMRQTYKKSWIRRTLAEEASYIVSEITEHTLRTDTRDGIAFARDACPL